jgi:hypothetical protein
MRNFVISAVSSLLLGVTATSASSEPDVMSASYVMKGCRSIIIKQKLDFAQGYCIGSVHVLFDLPVICYKKGVTVGHAVRIVIRYIDNNPERQHENFNGLALEALQASWPCKRS